MHSDENRLNQVTIGFKNLQLVLYAAILINMKLLLDLHYFLGILALSLSCRSRESMALQRLDYKKTKESLDTAGQFHEHRGRLHFKYGCVPIISNITISKLRCFA